MANEVTATLRLQVKEEVTTQLKKARDELQRFEKQSSAGRAQVKAFFQELAVPATGLGITAAVAAFAKQSIEAASALEAMESRSRLIYGDAFPRIQMQAGLLGQQLKRSSSDLLEMQTSMAGVFAGVGVTGRAMEDMSRKVSELAVDFGSFFHMADADAFETLRGAILGQTRALTRLGIVMNDDTLEAFALSKGIKRNVSDMNEAQIMTLRYNFLLENTKKIQGDAARNTSLFANQTKTLKGEWKDLMEVLGKPIMRVTAEGISTANTALGLMSQSINLVINDWVRYAKVVGNLFGADLAINDYRGSELKRLQGNLGIENVRAAAQAAKDAAKGQGDFWSGGGGGKGDELKDELQDAKDLLDSIKDIEEDITEHYGKQAEANKTLKEGLRENLKLKKEIGTLTKSELHDLNVLNRRLGDGRDAINEMKESWEKQKDVVDDLKKKVKDLNQEMLDGAKELKDSLAEVDRETGKRRAEKIADLMKEKQDLEGQLARAEGLSIPEQQRLEELAQTLRNVSLTDAAAFGQGQAFAGMNELQKIDLEAEQRKKELVLEANKKQEESVGKLMQANIDLAASEDRVKQLKDDLVTSMNKYEMGMKTTYAATEEATQKHVAGQIAELSKERAAVDALAASYAKVRTFVNKETKPLSETINQRASGGLTSGWTLVGEGGPEIVDLPTGSFVHSNRDSREMMSGSVVINIGTVQMKSEADVSAVARRLAREVQLQILGSS